MYDDGSRERPCFTSRVPSSARTSSLPASRPSIEAIRPTHARIDLPRTTGQSFAGECQAQASVATGDEDDGALDFHGVPPEVSAASPSFVSAGARAPYRSAGFARDRLGI